MFFMCCKDRRTGKSGETNSSNISLSTKQYVLCYFINIYHVGNRLNMNTSIW